MGFRFSKRINFGKGFGINISKSGITQSVRTKFGSFSTKGFFVRTGASGVGYRSSFGKGSGCVIMILFLAGILIIVDYV